MGKGRFPLPEGLPLFNNVRILIHCIPTRHPPKKFLAHVCETECMSVAAAVLGPFQCPPKRGVNVFPSPLAHPWKEGGDDLDGRFSLWVYPICNKEFETFVIVATFPPTAPFPLTLCVSLLPPLLALVGHRRVAFLPAMAVTFRSNIPVSTSASKSQQRARGDARSSRSRKGDLGGGSRTIRKLLLLMLLLLFLSQEAEQERMNW